MKTFRFGDVGIGVMNGFMPALLGLGLVGQGRLAILLPDFDPL